MSQQLVKKGANGRYSNVMPKSWIEAIKDKNTGKTLVEILQSFNMYFLPYDGNSTSTRCLVPTMLRKKGLWITYVKYDGNVYTEWYAADEIDDKSWGDSSNWRIGNNTLVGDITISANGNWVINGTETEFKAVGEKGNTPLIRVANNKLQVSYDLGDTYIDVTSNPVYTKFRWLATTGDTQANNVGRIQASTDEGNTWTNMSNDFINNLHISRYIGVNESLPTSGIAEGTIYAKGPYYAEDDTLNDNPIYRLWVYAWKGNTLAWQDNGEFTSIAAGVVQETGDSETEVMSQKAVSTKLSELGSELGKRTIVRTTGVADNKAWRFYDVILQANVTYIVKLIDGDGDGVKLAVGASASNNKLAIGNSVEISVAETGNPYIYVSSGEFGLPPVIEVYAKNDVLMSEYMPQIVENKKAINEVDLKTFTFKDVLTSYLDGYINADGTVKQSSYALYSDYIELIKDYEYYVIGSTSDAWYIGYYTAKNESSFIGNQKLLLSNSKDSVVKLIVPTDAVYVRISKSKNGRFCESVLIKNSIEKIESSINDIHNSLGEYVDIQTSYEDGYINSTGSVNQSSVAKYSSFIPIENNKRYYILGAVSSSWFVGFYKEANESSFISSIRLPDVSSNGETYVDVPIGTNYMRATVFKNGRVCTQNNINVREIQSKLSLAKDFYVGFDDKNTNSYNSVVECFYAACKETDKTRIHINEGVYDIFEELGGYDYVNQFVTGEDDWMNIQPVLENTELIGYGNVVLMYNPTQSYSSTWLFSPLNVKGNVKIENIEIRCSNCRYGIHDEDRGLSPMSTRYYKNVRVYANGVRPIACGFGKGVSVEYHDCYFKASIGNVYSCHGSPAVSVLFNNCILVGETTNVLRVSQIYTHTMNLVVNNTYVKEIVLSSEVSDDTIENQTSVRLLNTTTTFDNRYKVGKSIVKSCNTINGVYEEYEV